MSRNDSSLYEQLSNCRYSCWLLPCLWHLPPASTTHLSSPRVTTRAPHAGLGSIPTRPGWQCALRGTQEPRPLLLHLPAFHFLPSDSKSGANC